MISWIQRSFQRHFRIIFIVLLAGTIISFIFTIGAMPGIGGAERKAVQRDFFGLNLGSQEDQSRLMSDATLSVYLQAGGPALEGAQLQQYALQRRAALALADRFHLPATTAAEAADHIKTLRAFAGQNGEFDPQSYARFRDSLKNNPGVHEADVSRVVNDDVRVEKLQHLLAGPGYVLDADVRAQLVRADSTWTLAVATLDYASFNPALTPTDAELKKYYDDNAVRYEIPPRVNATYVEFPAAAYVPAVTLSDSEVKAYFDQFPGRFSKSAGDPKNPAATKPAEAADFALVRPQVEAAMKLDRARQLALKAASDFSLALYEKHIDSDTPAFQNLLASSKLTLKTLAPFTHEAGPLELGGAASEIADAAFNLNRDRWFSDALATPTGAVVLFWKELQPARQPDFAEVRAKVSADYLDNEKRQRFAQLGRTLRTAIETRLKAGDTFEKAVAAANTQGVKIDTKQLAPFTLRQPPADADYSILGALDRLEKGRVSDLIVNGDKGSLVYVVDKKTPDLAETGEQFTTARTQLAQMSSRLGSNATLEEVVERELARTEPKAP